MGLLEAFWKPPEQGAGGKPAAPELSERSKTRISEAEKKATKLGYQVKVRLAYLGESQTNAKLQMQAIVGTFKQFNSTNLNGFKVSSASFKKEDLEKYRARLFADKGYILNCHIQMWRHQTLSGQAPKLPSRRVNYQSSLATTLSTPTLVPLA
jgi:hypothetical protein